MATKEQAVANIKPDQRMLAALAMLLSSENPLDPEKGHIAGTAYHEREDIILPKGMEKDVASAELMRQFEEEETLIDQRHDFDKWDWNDALVSVMRQINEMFGWVNAQARVSMFGTQLPMEIQLPVGIQDDGVILSEAGFLGDFKVSAWGNAKGTVSVKNNGRVAVTFKVKKKYKERVVKFFQACEHRLTTDSVYKGKSVVYEPDENGRLGFSFFRNKTNPHIFLNENEERILNNLVIAPLAKRSNRKMLFFGTYGKSLPC